MIDSELMDEIREAAAQGKTSLHEKVCKMCNGSKLTGFKDELGHFVRRCPVCDGTGKEKAK